MPPQFCFNQRFWQRRMPGRIISTKCLSKQLSFIGQGSTRPEPMSAWTSFICSPLEFALITVAYLSSGWVDIARKTKQAGSVLIGRCTRNAVCTSGSSCLRLHTFVIGIISNQSSRRSNGNPKPARNWLPCLSSGTATKSKFICRSCTSPRPREFLCRPRRSKVCCSSGQRKFIASAGNLRHWSNISKREAEPY